jgi:hypothetical protein
VRTTSLTKPIVLAVAVAAGALGMAIPATASAVPLPTVVARPAAPAAPAVHRQAEFSLIRRVPLPSDEHYVCPVPASPGQMECMSILHTLPGGIVPAINASASDDYGPSQLQSAYRLTSAAAHNARGVTVAIVDAYQNPDAASNLSHYRSHFHLSPCPVSNGCLKIVNESGKTSPLPAKNSQWGVEESLDLDMVSAICPNCHILLVEATTDSTQDLGTAEDTAIAKGARYVSNSWSGGEYFGQDSGNSFFNHPGDVLDFAAGDSGYGPAYPTDLQYVTAVGGTTLTRSGNSRGWSESAWGSATPGNDGTGGGCSAFEPKPSWQRADATAPDGCLNRTENDVSADANPNTGALVYDTYQQGGFLEIGGTSEATPIITATYALAGTPSRGSYPAEYPYRRSGDLFNVTSGVNGQCESFRRYLCHGQRGYNGPTGLGTPDGTAGFTSGSAHLVTLIDPGTQDLAVHSRFGLTITGLDTSRASSLRWSATGLPAGLSIRALRDSTNGEISGTLPATAKAYNVTVTAKDGSVTGITHFSIVTVPSLSAPNPPSGPVVLAAPDLCLDGGTDASGQAVRVQNCDNPTSQDWAFVSASQPDGVDTFKIAGECLTIANTAPPQKATLAACNGGLQQQWEYLGEGAVWSPFTGGCLNANETAGASVNTTNCNFNNNQSWTMPAGPLVEGAGGLCLDNTTGTTVEVVSCNYSDQPAEAGQLWTLQDTGQITSSDGECLTSTGTLTQSAMTLQSCDANNGFQFWEPGPSGELQNIGLNLVGIGFNLCLADLNNGGSGSAAVQSQCYGDAGETWGLN